MNKNDSIKSKLHDLFIEKSDKIDSWFKSNISNEEYPFYCSFDIRESDHKMAPVDANMFPAGFNNICQDDRDAMGELLDRCMNFKDLNFKNIGIFCENHKNNLYYWDNVHALKVLFEEKGFSVFILIPELVPEQLGLESASGHLVEFSKPVLKNSKVFVGEQELDFILINNDLSSDYDSWIKEASTKMLPPIEMGWNKRNKQSFFDHYNQVVEEFSDCIGIDKNHLSLETQTFNEFDINEKESLLKLSELAESLNDDLKSSYSQSGFDEKPYLFVKNNRGTYGLGVLEVTEPSDILSWNYKSRKKMKASKGGGGVSSVIVQEGIPTTLKADDSPAEAVIYLLGCGLAGGFLRTNKRKDSFDSLNAPGAVFERMCFSDYEFEKEDRSLENVYGIIARLGALALSREIREMLK